MTKKAKPRVGKPRSEAPRKTYAARASTARTASMHLWEHRGGAAFGALNKPGTPCVEAQTQSTDKYRKHPRSFFDRAASKAHTHARTSTRETL